MEAMSESIEIKCVRVETYGAVVGRGRNFVVVERIPLEVEDGARVTDDFAAQEVNATRRVQRNHDEGRVGFDGQK